MIHLAIDPLMYFNGEGCCFNLGHGRHHLLVDVFGFGSGLCKGEAVGSGQDQQRYGDRFDHDLNGFQQRAESCELVAE